mmetsp:Transcript_7409/g.10386  ORF Transcript_7409/g.10386 Transcript_7409/m.10386 type:complete len:167 (+) Transcript_7409:111-611(+)
MTASANKFSTAVNQVYKSFPTFLHSPIITMMFCGMVKFAGTAGVKFEELNPQRAVLTLKNRKKVRNHIGGIHACGMALISESATGALLAMNVPDSNLPLCKSFKIDFKRIAKGDLKAVATLSDEQMIHILSSEKGDLIVPVEVTDQDGNEPIKAEMHWAWIPKNKP